MRRFTLSILMVIAPGLAFSQHLGSVRGVAMGAFTAAANDANSLDWNPAGLVYAKDWELSASNFFGFRAGAGENGFTFHNMSLAKQFPPSQSAAIRYSPGAVSEFIVPNLFTVIDSATNIQGKVDKKITYAERYSMGYGYRSNENVSFGLAARYRQEEIVDTRLFTVRDSLTYISSRTVTSTANSWNIDFGLLWRLNERWRLGMVTRNLFKILESEFPEDLKTYSLEAEKLVRGGLSFTPTSKFLFTADLSTKGDGATGYEWNLSGDFFLRQGIYWGKTLSPFINAAAVGFGWGSRSIQADVAYLHFFDRTTHGGTVSLNDFLSHSIRDVEFHSFTTDQLRLSVKLNLGRPKEQLARIDYVEILSDVYPSSYETFAYRPIGKVKVRNISERPIEAKAAFYLKPYMDGPTETKRYLIEPGMVADIPFTAIFNDLIKAVTEPQLRDGDIYVIASPAEDYDDKSTARVRIYSRNNWDGQALSLRYFMTPADPDVLQFTRSVLIAHKEQLGSVDSPQLHFEQARILFNEFAKRLTYVNDPKLSKDWAQYPSETLRLRGGDCDDMTVCYSSLLASIGIASAFIDVIPPGDPGNAHIYMMFDTGIEASKAYLISLNRKRYVSRKNATGVETVWIPIETTEITKGFEEAWSIGAQEYFNDIETGLGLMKGWVKIVDLQ